MTNQPFRFSTKSLIEINGDAHGRYNSQIKFKTSMLKSSLCDYSNVYILVKGTITVPNTADVDASASNTNKKVIFENCGLFSDCIREINNTQIDNAKDLDVAILINNLIEYSNNYSKTSGKFVAILER